MAEHSEYCPVMATLSLLEQKWVLHIFYALLGGPRRFNELASAVGHVNSRTLSERLKLLEDQGFVRRTVKESIPPWVEYELTEKGKSLGPVIDHMAEWGRTWMEKENDRMLAGFQSRDTAPP